MMRTRKPPPTDHPAPPPLREARRRGALLLSAHESATISACPPGAFQGASLRGAKLDGARLDGLDLRNADLSGARLVGASLQGTNLVNARLVKANLSFACLDQADLTLCDLSLADLVDTSLVGACLDKVLMQRVNLRGASLLGATLSSTEGEPSDLVGCQFDARTYENSRWQVLRVEEWTRQGAVLQGLSEFPEEVRGAFIIPPPRPFDVFISYSHKDKRWVREQLLERLRKNGLKVAIDQDRFVIGHLLEEDISRHLRSSRHVLFVISPWFNRSKWTLKERRLAFQVNQGPDRERLVAVVLNRRSVPKEMRAQIRCDLCGDEQHNEESWSKLLELLLAGRG